MKTKILLITIACFISGALYSQIIHVPADYNTIQESINAASDGDTVLVDTGTYVENINFSGKDIIVASLFLTTQDTMYIYETVIDGNQNGSSVVRFENEESQAAELCGFTITHGNSSTSGGGIACVYSSPKLNHLIISENSAAYNGGGIICGAFASPSLDHVIFTSNTAGGDGGAIYCYNNCNPTLENVIINSNSTPNHGGGICCLESCSPILNSVSIEDNTANQGGGIFSAFESNFNLMDVIINGNSAAKGGGIYMTENSPFLSNLDISNNQANLGGGIFCDNANPVMQNLKIIDNISTDKGGGISMYQSSPEMQNITIEDNLAWIGGGIFCLESSPSLINVLINNNEAVYDMEGIGGGIAFLNSTPSLVNVSMANNYAGTICGGIYLSINSQLTLSNCILWNNNPIEIYFDPNSGADTLTVSYSDIQGGADSIMTNNKGEVIWLAGNINQDPFFVGSEEYPFQINDYSPCINAGTPDTTGLKLPEYDLAGEVRIFNDRVDMGAFEWNTMVGIDEPGVGNTNLEICCYPNPFSTTTTIEYELAKSSTVQLTIYDYLGKRIEVIERKQAQGQQQIIWNAEGLPAGVYYFRLQAGEQVASGKLVLLR